MGLRRSLSHGVRPKLLHLREFGNSEEPNCVHMRLLLLEEDYNLAGE